MIRIFRYKGKLVRRNAGGIAPSRAIQTVLWFALGKRHRGRMELGKKRV